MTIQSLLIFVNKEQSKCQEKLNVRPKNVGEGKQGGCYIWIKSSKELLLGGKSNLDMAYAGVQHLAERPHGCPRFAANLAIIFDIQSLNKKE